MQNETKTAGDMSKGLWSQFEDALTGQNQGKNLSNTKNKKAID
jgi:hypothetical protein